MPCNVTQVNTRAERLRCFRIYAASCTCSRRWCDSAAGQGYGGARVELRRGALRRLVSQPQQLPGGDAASVRCVQRVRVRCVLAVLRVLDFSFAQQSNGALITSCDIHDHLIGDLWNKIEVDGKSMRFWLTQWLLRETNSSYVYAPSLTGTKRFAKSLTPYRRYDVEWPLNPTCPGPK
jgi:hypothetical protein